MPPKIPIDFVIIVAYPVKYYFIGHHFWGTEPGILGQIQA